jgi:hypothetical protein
MPARAPTMTVRGVFFSFLYVAYSSFSGLVFACGAQKPEMGRQLNRDMKLLLQLILACVACMTMASFLKTVLPAALAPAT